MMVIYRREPWAEFWSQARPLLAAHKAEVAHYADIPLQVDESRYAFMERCGALRVYTGRLGSRLVAYCLMIVQPNAHYSSSLQAAQDVLYVDPAQRHGRTGMRLIQFVEQELKQEGVQVVHQHSKIAHPALGRLLDYLDYERTDIVHAKRLDK